MTKRATPLLDVHRRLGAKLTEFGGWTMPLQYSGIVAEHNAVRNAVGVFDVSHLGKLRVTGSSLDALQRAVTCDVMSIPVGKAAYGLVLSEDAGCIDDLFVYRLAPHEALVVPNAANVEAVATTIRELGGEVADEWDRFAILAIQGPDSFALFERAFPNSDATKLELHSWEPIDVLGVEGLVARTGYTGERGFELYAPAQSAVAAFEMLLELGAAPVGLGARDTLRLEMGYALYGHELTLDTNPLEANLGWAVSWDAPFRGKEALEKIKADGPARRLFGIVCRDKGVPRQGYRVLKEDVAIGEVASGNHSPTLGAGIALAFGDRAQVPAVGDVVAVEARGRQIAGDIVKPPFISRKRAAQN